ncbi:hypothetical protein BC628DRAFT_1380203 [Trametes gibbosa]|nr:hypothetical protein BC628DRAFT_1380203 [Trametes gibbosa]
MLSFAATVNVLLLILFIASFHAPRPVAGAPTNTTLGLNSALVTFTPGWRTATFSEDGSRFAFADGLNEEVRITLPQNTTAVFYEGFRVAGGGLYLACLDCALDVESGQLIGINASIVDAHDSRENGTQLPDTLFSFTDLDPVTNHVLIVVNMEDPQYNNTSQITFDSAIVTTDSQEVGNSTASSSIVILPNLPTLTVTAIESSSTIIDSPTTSPPGAHGPISTDPVTDTATTSAGLPAATMPGDTNTSDPAQSTPPPGGQSGTTTIATTGGADQGTTTAQSPGASPTDTQIGGNTQPGQTNTGVGTATDTTSASTGDATSSATPTDPPSGTSQSAGGSPPSSTPQPSGGSASNGSSQPTGASPPNGTPSPTGGSGVPTSPGDGTSLPSPSISAIFTDPNAPPGATGTPPASNNGAAGSTGVSKPVIIAIAVVASLFVLALLGAVLLVLVRNRAVRQTQTEDVEGGVGLVREAAPTAMVSVPQGLAPMRPQNPFADTVPADVPLDAPSAEGASAEAAADGAYEIEEVLLAPQPQPPPPPIPPKSPLRGNFRSSPWLNRVPRNSSPTSPS